MTFGEKLKLRREFLNLTLEETAKGMGIKKSVLQKWERDDLSGGIIDDKLEAISKTLDIPVVELTHMGPMENYRNSRVAVQRELFVLANIKEVYGEDLKNVVFRAVELNKAGFAKLNEYCGDLLQIAQYRDDYSIELTDDIDSEDLLYNSKPKKKKRKKNPNVTVTTLYPLRLKPDEDDDEYEYYDDDDDDDVIDNNDDFEEKLLT
jgi:transcriptional regulator with XRE-family HTH domain